MDTSLIILYIVLAICAAVLTGFAAYALYHSAKTMKQWGETSAKIDKQVDKIDIAVTSASNAITSVSNTVKSASDALSKPMNGIMQGIKIAQNLIEKFQQNKQPQQEECECEEE